MLYNFIAEADEGVRQTERQLERGVGGPLLLFCVWQKRLLAYGSSQVVWGYDFLPQMACHMSGAEHP